MPRSQHVSGRLARVRRGSPVSDGGLPMSDGGSPVSDGGSPVSDAGASRDRAR